MNAGTIDDAAALIRQAHKLMVTCHLGPDGDSIGSMSALGTLLAAAGREVVLYNPDPAPRFLKWLPGIDRLTRQTGGPHDLTVIVDCGDAQLLGPRFPEPGITGPLVVIDHHAAARPFGDLYVADPDAASVGVLVARLARALELPIGPDAAVAIYVSLV